MNTPIISTKTPISELKRPTPPKPEDVAKAAFVDKTYRWSGK